MHSITNPMKNSTLKPATKSVLKVAAMVLFAANSAFADTALEQKVLSQIHGINLTEIAAGKLALANGQNESVKKFGQHLIDDHKKADDKVTALAKKQKINLEKGATEPEVQKGAAANKKTLDELQALKGAEFDKVFLDDMVDGHVNAIKLAKQAYDDASDPIFKSFLGDLLPELQHHHDMAADLEKKTAVNHQ